MNFDLLGLYNSWNIIIYESITSEYDIWAETFFDGQSSDIYTYYILRIEQLDSNISQGPMGQQQREHIPALHRNIKYAAA